LFCFLRRKENIKCFGNFDKNNSKFDSAISKVLHLFCLLVAQVPNGQGGGRPGGLRRGRRGGGKK
jgi:hypothetical protein